MILAPETRLIARELALVALVSSKAIAGGLPSATIINVDLGEDRTYRGFLRVEVSGGAYTSDGLGRQLTLIVASRGGEPTYRDAATITLAPGGNTASGIEIAKLDRFVQLRARPHRAGSDFTNLRVRFEHT